MKKKDIIKALREVKELVRENRPVVDAIGTVPGYTITDEERDAANDALPKEREIEAMCIGIAMALSLAQFMLTEGLGNREPIDLMNAVYGASFESIMMNRLPEGIGARAVHFDD